MRTPERSIEMVPGSLVVHPPGEVHEYRNGPQRTLLLRVRHGAAMTSRRVSWDSRAGWKQPDEDKAFFTTNPERLQAEVT